MERVTGIEPALSAWEAVPSRPVTWPDLRGGVSVSDRERPPVTGVNSPLWGIQLTGAATISGGGQDLQPLHVVSRSRLLRLRKYPRAEESEAAGGGELPGGEGGRLV